MARGVRDSLTSPTASPCPSSDSHPPIVRDEGQVYCNSTWDTVTCWPTTKAGELAVMACPSNFQDVRFDTSENATKMCFENGHWEIHSNYSSCQPIQRGDEHAYESIIRIIYLVGFTTSTAALVVALFIFLYYKSLRCLRNTIHCHLIVTFIAKNVLWVIMHMVMPHLNTNEIVDENDASKWLCKMLVVIYNYIQTANFFWMLVEGVYLHTMIVWTFTIEKVRFLYYAILGWGVPSLIVFVWAMVRAYKANKSCWLPKKNGEEAYYDYIYIGPILLVLLINLIFLASIVWVLITKLRASNTLHIRQYRKAVKATLILLPLLGITYVLFIAPPSDDETTGTVFSFINACLQSTQGLAVAFFYCFLNGEVQSTIRTRWSRWQDGRSIMSTRYSRASIATGNEHIGLTRNLTNLDPERAGDHSPVQQENGGPSVSTSNKDYLKNNNTNGVNHMNSPILHDGDEAL